MPTPSVPETRTGSFIPVSYTHLDHKRAYDQDKGPNTGGMGTFSPSRIYSAQLAGQCMAEIFLPTIRAMAAEGRPFKGVLYFGLMITKDGPKVIEYNARFGDPETQVVLPRLKTDLVDILNAVMDEKLDEIQLTWDEGAAACVVMASGGYPGKYQTGLAISGLEQAAALPDTMIYHAGTKLDQGVYYTAGGRVLGVTRLGHNLDDAIRKTYEAVEKIHFDHAHYRTDIGIK